MTYRIPISGNALADWTKRTEKINGNTVSVYTKGSDEIKFDGVYWLFEGRKVEYLDEIN